MRKNKKEYSLTSRQRKEQRDNELKKNEPKEAEKTFEEMTEEEQAVILEQQQQRKNKNKRMMRFVAIIAAIILAAGSITTGAVLLVKANNIDNSKVNPTAIITLDNNGKTQKLEMELYYNAAPAAVANFIYLSLNGFYNNTIFNATSGDERFLAMSGYTSASTHRAKETSFVEGLKGFKTHTGNTWLNSTFKLSYRITRIDNNPGDTSQRGRIAFLGGSSLTYSTSTTFLIMGQDPNLLLNGTSISSYLTYIGKLTDESMKIVDEINAIEDVVQNTTYDSTRWSFVNPETNSIKIKSISINKLNRGIKNNILDNFEEFVLTSENGLKGLAQWSSRYKTDDYYLGS